MRYQLRHTTIFAIFGGVMISLMLFILHHREFSSLANTRQPDSFQPSLAARPAVIPMKEPWVCENLYRAVCQGQNQTRRDPTGLLRSDVEGERMVVAIYKDLISKHPEWTPDQIDEELAHLIFTPQRRGRILAAYQWVQSHIENFIERQSDRIFSAQEKRVLKARIQKTALELPPPISVYADEPDLITKNDVFYERTTDGSLRMRVGGAYLFTAKSWFNMVFTMGHELGHAIDPCELRNAQLSLPAYDRLEACFLKTGWVGTPKNRLECQENDQLSEAFADWIATEVTSEALKTFSTEFHGTQLINSIANAVRDLCDEENEEIFETIDHPSPQTRIEQIFGERPEIRSILGCVAPPPARASLYCGFETDLSKIPDSSQNKVSP